MLLTFGEGWGSTPSSLESDTDTEGRVEVDFEAGTFPVGVLVRMGEHRAAVGERPLAAAPSSNVNPCVFVGFFVYRR